MAALGEVGQSPIVRSRAHRPGVLSRARSSSRATPNDRITIAPSSRISRARSIDAVDAPRSWAPPRVPPPVPSPRARSSSRARLVARSSSATRATRSSRAPRSLRTLVEACRRSTKCGVSAPLTTSFWAPHRDARPGRGDAPRALESTVEPFSSALARSSRRVAVGRARAREGRGRAHLVTGGEIHGVARRSSSIRSRTRRHDAV